MRLRITVRLCLLLIAAVAVLFAWIRLSRSNRFEELKVHLQESASFDEPGGLQFIVQSSDELRVLLAAKSHGVYELRIRAAEELSRLDFESLKAFSNLKQLALIYERQIEILPSDLDRCQELSSLTISLAGQHIGHSTLESILRLAHLDSLDLTGTDLGDDDIATFANGPQLKRLRLGFTDITDDGIEELCRIQKAIQLLELTETRITDRGLHSIANLAELQTLHLAGVDVSDEGVQQVARLQKLTYLSISAISEARIAELQRRLPACTIFVRAARQ
ncbi:MAG: hypothetical protein U0795_10585 [Pirellulales bacterium]